MKCTGSNSVERLSKSRETFRVVDTLITSASIQSFNTEPSVNVPALILVFSIFGVPSIKSIIKLGQIGNEVSVRSP